MRAKLNLVVHWRVPAEQAWAGAGERQVSAHSDRREDRADEHQPAEPQARPNLEVLGLQPTDQGYQIVARQTRHQ